MGQKISEESKPEAETQASKRRKVVQKTVVTVKVEAKDGKQKSEGPPSDSWSWRKYGQKPIKGSPFPRGYYRCSTSKGCSAKKQVERCKTDSSLLIISYTSTHNHPCPDHLSSPTTTTTTTTTTKPTHQSEEDTHQNQPPSEEEEEDLSINPQKEDPEQETEQLQQQQQSFISTTAEETNTTGEGHNFHYSQSPFNSSENLIIIHQREEEVPFGENLEKACNHVIFDGEPLSLDPPSDLLLPTVVESEENDRFFDELEELPMISSSSFTSFMRSSFFDERILVHPS